MSLITNLNSRDLNALCEIITPKEIRNYFKKNPHKFNKIKPGFRPESLSDNDIFTIVETNRKDSFIEDYFDNNIPLLIDTIEKDFPDFGKDDNFDYPALVKEINKTPFAKYPKLYFTLTSRVYSKDVEEKILSQMAKQVNVSSPKKTVKPIKTSSITKIEELQEQIASLRTENEEYQNKLANLQDNYNQLNERFSYEESSIDFDEVFNEYEHLSVGLIAPDYYGNRWVYRLADIGSSEDIIPFIEDSSQPPLFSNRKRLYFKEKNLQDGFLGIWAWYAETHKNDPSKDHIVSNYYPQYSPVELIIVDNCSSIDDLVAELSKGLALSPGARRFAITFFNSKTDRYTGVLCHKSDIENTQGVIRLKSDVISLPIYSFEQRDILQLNDSKRIYNKLQLGPADDVIKTISDSEIVKKLILDSIPWSVFKQRGVSRGEWQNFKKYLDELKNDDIKESIKDSLGCSSEEADHHLNAFIENASDYLDATSFDDNVLRAVVEGDDTLMSKCIDIAREKWLSDNKGEVEKANEELKTIQEKIVNAKNKLSSVKEECEKEIEKAAPYKELIENGDSLAKQVQEKVTNRINAARKDASDFLAEMAFYYPNTYSETTNHEPEEVFSFFTNGIRLDEPEELKDWEDSTETLKLELIEAGVDSNKANGLSEYLYSAFINRIPLLLIGPSGANIIDALSASLFGRTAGTLTLPENYDKKVEDTCLHSDSKIIKIINPLTSSWLPHLPGLLQSKDVFFCAVYPFPEDIQFEPNSLCNLFLPLYTELFVKSSPTSQYIGGVFSPNYTELTSPPVETFPHMKDLGLLHSSMLVKERMQIILSYMNEMNNGNFEDNAFSTVVLPYVLTTQQNSLLKEFLDEKWNISSALKDEISQIWGEFE